MERVAGSRYIHKSARLRDLLLYLCDRVLEGSAEEIHEQQVGHEVFGRAPDYDTGADNIVRVHASQLRKRLEQYFSSEGRDETLVIEIPKGNYAPVFRERGPGEAPAPIEEAPLPETRRTDWRLWALAATAALFAASTLWLAIRPEKETGAARPEIPDKPSVQLFWSRIFRPGQPTDIILDDAAVGLYQELTGQALGLSDYKDRAYLRTLRETAARARLDVRSAESMVLSRHSSYANANFLWRLVQMAAPLQKQSSLQFARDYTFRDWKANNTILLGSSLSNPWVVPFESNIGLHWVYDKDLGGTYPVDTWAKAEERDRYRTAPDPQGSRPSYCGIALLPKQGGMGSVLIVAGTGGSAIGAGADFLANDHSVSQLRARLPEARDNQFPYFEALLQVSSRHAASGDMNIVICRPPR